MSIRTKVLGMVDVMMRVPPILVIDEILKIDMGLPSSSGSSSNSAGNSGAGGGGGGGGVGNVASAIVNAIENTTAGVLGAAAAAATNSATTTTTTSSGGGVLSQSFGALIEDFAKDTYISDLLALTSVKFLICLLGE